MTVRIAQGMCRDEFRTSKESEETGFYIAIVFCAWTNGWSLRVPDLRVPEGSTDFDIMCL